MKVLEKLENTQLVKAALLYSRRQNRLDQPDGSFDRSGRWYPSEEERQVCCSGIRTPSRAFPYSLNAHCRSIEHIAHLTGVDKKELRKAVK